MSKTAFLVACDRAAVVANDVSDVRYCPSAQHVPVGVQVPIRMNATDETHFMVEDGLVEFMIGGASGFVLAADFVRVPPGVPYAYRNAGDIVARLLVRTANPDTLRRALRISIECAA